VSKKEIDGGEEWIARVNFLFAYLPVRKRSEESPKIRKGFGGGKKGGGSGGWMHKTGEGKSLGVDSGGAKRAPSIGA